LIRHERFAEFWLVAEGMREAYFQLTGELECGSRMSGGRAPIKVGVGVAVDINGSWVGMLVCV